MTAIRKREINLYGGRCGPQARQGQARISRFDARFTAAALLYSPTCSLFSFLFSWCCSLRTNEGSPRIPLATSTALPYANQIKVALEGIYTAASTATLKNRCGSRGIARACDRVTAGVLWMANTFKSFHEELSFTLEGFTLEGLMFFANLDCQQWRQNNLEWRIWSLFSLLLLSLLLFEESKNWIFSSSLI